MTPVSSWAFADVHCTLAWLISRELSTEDAKSRIRYVLSTADHWYSIPLRLGQTILLRHETDIRHFA